MLGNLLGIVKRDGFIQRSMLARELNIDEGLVEEGLKELLRMGYLVEEDTGADCVSVCKGCPFAKNCGKEIVKTYTLSEKGEGYLKN